MLSPKSQRAFVTLLGLASLGLGACDNGSFLSEIAQDIAQRHESGGKKPPDPCGTGGSAGSGGASGGMACVTKTQGSEVSCKSSVDWKVYATESCAAAGLVLGSVEPTGDCGNGGTRYVKYTCCPAAPPPPPPPPPPPASSCTDEVQGSDVSCKSAADWKQYASDSCLAAGLLLSDYEPMGDCGKGGTRYVKYTCCPAAPPPPPPPSSCIDQMQGSEVSCKSAVDWKLYATQACTAAGLILGSVEPTGDCGKGGTRYVKYTCCPSAPPPSCVGRFQGGDTSCKSAAAWKQAASADCEQKGLVLSDYKTAEECNEDAFRSVNYTCCPVTSPPPPPPPPPPASSCGVITEGSETSCKSAAAWKQFAFDSCTAAGLVFVSYEPITDCGGGNTRYVKYTCCK